MQVCTGSRRELGLFHLFDADVNLIDSLQFIGWCRTSEVGKDWAQCSHCNYFDFDVVLSCLVLLCIKVCVCQNHIPGRHFRLCRSSSLSLREIVSSGRSAKALHFWEKDGKGGQKQAVNSQLFPTLGEDRSSVCHRWSTWWWSPCAPNSSVGRLTRRPSHFVILFSRCNKKTPKNMFDKIDRQSQVRSDRQFIGDSWWWLVVMLPSRELTYPPKKWHFEDDFPFPKVGYLSSLDKWESRKQQFVR